MLYLTHKRRIRALRVLPRNAKSNPTLSMRCLQSTSFAVRARVVIFSEAAMEGEVMFHVLEAKLNLLVHNVL
jgi:hypothetical protein